MRNRRRKHHAALQVTASSVRSLSSLVDYRASHSAAVLMTQLVNTKQFQSKNTSAATSSAPDSSITTATNADDASENECLPKCGSAEIVKPPTNPMTEETHNPDWASDVASLSEKEEPKYLHLPNQNNVWVRVHEAAGILELIFDMSAHQGPTKSRQNNLVANLMSHFKLNATSKLYIIGSVWTAIGADGECGIEAVSAGVQGSSSPNLAYRSEGTKLYLYINARGATEVTEKSRKLVSKTTAMNVHGTSRSGFTITVGFTGDETLQLPLVSDYIQSKGAPNPTTEETKRKRAQPRVQQLLFSMKPAEGALRQASYAMSISSTDWHSVETVNGNILQEGWVDGQ